MDADIARTEPNEWMPQTKMGLHWQSQATLKAHYK